MIVRPKYFQAIWLSVDIKMDLLISPHFNLNNSRAHFWSDLNPFPMLVPRVRALFTLNFVLKCSWFFSLFT